MKNQATLDAYVAHEIKALRLGYEPHEQAAFVRANQESSALWQRCLAEGWTYDEGRAALKEAMRQAT